MAGDEGIMTEKTEATRPTRRPLGLWIGIGAVIAVVVALIVWAIVANASPSASPSPAPTSAAPSASADPSASASPEPSGSVSPSPSAEPTDDPDDPDAQPSPRPTKKPVDIDEPAVVEKGVTVSLTSIEPIEGQATVPGDVAGPALLITVKAVNKSKDDINTPAVIVNVFYGDDETPASILTRPREDFPPVLAAGKAESGQFAFTVPTDERGDIRIEVDLSVGSPVVLFEGSVS
jgi:cytoskeletal protein RodZ